MPFDEAHVRAIAGRVAESFGLEVVDMEFHGVGKGRMLRVFIEKNAKGRRALEQQLAVAAQAGQTVSPPSSWDRLAGVTHEDCADYSRELGTILDVEDIVPGGEYLLEVSSPGLDRKLVKLADFQRFAGSTVKIMTREPIAGNRHFKGRLASASNDQIVLAVDAAKNNKNKKKGKNKQAVANDVGLTIQIEMRNIERARLVPEI